VHCVEEMDRERGTGEEGGEREGREKGRRRPSLRKSL